MTTDTYHIGKKRSGNQKTGPMFVTTSSPSTCPEACPFRRNGCYADSGPLRMHWDKVASGERGGSWEALQTAVSKIPTGELWRHNQAGDLPHNDGTIDREKVLGLARASEGRRGFTYTHHELTTANVETLRLANEAGFTVNVSANRMADLDAMPEGLPLVTVLPADAPKVQTTTGGKRVVRCPATNDGSDVSCFTCGLCAQPDRDYAVGFPVHGTGHRKAAKVVEG